ncbi:hypothetical protein LK07_11530 [Streptomyces pluripotens]|uniref:Uncharacterized protein n=1 Tax=Streptomyces pluripotens TaxID=1355015 RepID=A0A221NX67_9ACTN|nr:hypothetical protein LK06_010405 [Streptomyces pluripotens]ASN24567.1 hypothetical protein LK07_11530 [Streptomyces pluripotens]KIE28087.1 hypothetical protein LK08_05305 [Streptomyces sp. MUSC 125]
MWRVGRRTFGAKTVIVDLDESDETATVKPPTATAPARSSEPVEKHQRGRAHRCPTLRRGGFY